MWYRVKTCVCVHQGYSLGGADKIPDEHVVHGKRAEYAVIKEHEVVADDGPPHAITMVKVPKRNVCGHMDMSDSVKIR